MHKIRDNIISCLIDHADRTPDKSAFVFVDGNASVEKTISFAQLAADVRKRALSLSKVRVLHERGLLVYQDRYEFILSFLACQYVGMVPLPVSYVKGKRQFLRLGNIIKDAQATVVLCSDQTVLHLQQGLNGFPGTEGITIITTDVVDSPETQIAPAFNEIAFIQYTSGSTGNPKGVIISHDNLMHNQQLIRDAFACNADSIIFSWLPFYHDMGLIGNILHAIYIGCTCMSMSPFHFMQAPLKWLQAISTFGVTHSGGANFAFDLCVDKIDATELSRLDLSCWKSAYNGSEPVRYETLQRFARHFRSAGFKQDAFQPCYGLAEATLLVAGAKKNAQPNTIFVDRKSIGSRKLTLTTAADIQALPLVSAGMIAPGMDLLIVATTDQHVCGELEEGEICIAGPSVSSGYWNYAGSGLFYELEGKSYLRTGDLGFLYQEELFVHGRVKEMMIVRGQNYYPADIESIVTESHNAIAENGVAVFSIPTPEEEVVIAIEVKRELIKVLDAADLITAVDNAITGFFGIVAYDIILTTPMGIPRTTSGKLQRLSCRSLYQEGGFNIIASKQALDKGITTTETDSALIAKVISNGDYEIIKEYLMGIIIHKVGRLPDRLTNDNIELTEIGIDSLRSMELINAINKDLNINMDVTMVLKANTLSGLINAMQNMLWLKNGQVTGKEIII